MYTTFFWQMCGVMFSGLVSYVPPLDVPKFMVWMAVSNLCALC